MLEKRSLYWQLTGFALVVVAILLLSRFFPIVDFVAALQRRVMHWGPWSALCYPLLFALCNVLLLPGGILSVGGGFFFGLWWGFVIVLLGNSIGAAISFALTRLVGARWFRQRLSRNPTLRVLEPAVEREGWKIILLSQLHPFFPTSLLNYFYALTRIPFRTYMLWVAVGRAPGLFLYVYLGTLGQYGISLIRGELHPRLMEYWIWGGAFITTALLLFVLSRIALREIRNPQDALDSSSHQNERANESVST